jgi:hydroxymethylbilane synthase
MSAATLRIGTRASQLALWQAQRVRELLRSQPGAPAVELVHIRTQGDQQREVPLWRVGGRAFFTREIDEALLTGEVDIAVHSLKDLPTQLEPGIALAATLARADPRDALVSRSGASLERLPRDAHIGTSSLRRRAFLTRARPDAQLLDLRGNVPTRLERLTAGDYDAIVLAAAGLERLGLAAKITERLAPERFPPAVSQGIIGVCARAADAAVLQWLSPLDDAPTRLAAQAERALLKRIEGGCQVPLGALAVVSQGRIQLDASVCALDGSRCLAARGSAGASGGEAQALGERVAEELLAQGAAELIAVERGALAVAAP